MRKLFSVTALLVAIALHGAEYDVLIRNGTIYDGSGKKPYHGDLAISGGKIAALGQLKNARGRVEIDAQNLAVAPGCINMLSWANESLIQDGRSQSDLRQGVTLEVMGEGDSMGPLNDAMKKEGVAQEADIKYTIAWTTLGEYLNYLVKRGVSCNVASFVGATTARIPEIVYAGRPPPPHDRAGMKGLLRQASLE